MSNKSYDVIADRILALIDKGACPWRMPWSKTEPDAQLNATTRKAYRGINQILTMMTNYFAGYQYDTWLTYKQAQELGGQVRKGEHGTPVVRFGEYEAKDAADNEKTTRRGFMRHYTVFNVAQIDGLPEEYYQPRAATLRDELCAIPACEQIVSGWDDRPEIEPGGNRACYNPAQDKIKMPPQAAFGSDPEYYSTLFHELGHATGHTDRLARKAFRDNEYKTFGSYDYGCEELVAEFTAAFLCWRAGIDCAVIDNQAAYLDNWRKAIKADPKILVIAAGQAQKAADLILGQANSLAYESAEAETAEAV